MKKLLYILTVTLLLAACATDNADNMIEDLKLEYNKLRQESITNELLDIIGGSFGRSS